MNKTINGLMAGSLCSLAMIGTVHGGGFDYSYADLTYYYNDSDFVDGDGFNVRLSFAVHEYVQLRGSFTHAALDSFDPKPGPDVNNVDKDEFGIGFGVNYSLTDWLDAIGGWEYVIESFSKDKNNTEEGYRFDVGVRVQPMKRLELTAGYLYQDTSPNTRNSSRNGFFIGPTIQIAKKFAIVARTHMADADDGDEKEYFVGLRALF